MAASAMRKLHILPGSGQVDAPSRLNAAAALPDWLAKGGPRPVQTPRGPQAPPLVYLSEDFALGGSESNITLVAQRAVNVGHFICGIAKASVLHPRSEAVHPARLDKCARLAALIRSWRTGGEGMLGMPDDGYRIDLIMLLALEILDGPRSRFATYIATLPKLHEAAPPSLWPYLDGKASGVEAMSILREASIAECLATDAIELAPLLAPAPDAAMGEAAQDAHGRGAEVLATLAAAVPGATVAAARHAVMRALGLVSSRFVSGVGLAPLLDLCNGTVSGVNGYPVRLNP